MTTFSVATNRPSRPDNPPEADWHRVVCFSKTAELAGRYLKRGQAVLVEGRLTYSKWEGGDGQTHRTAEVQATEVVPLGRFADAEPTAADPADDAELVSN